MAEYPLDRLSQALEIVSRDLPWHESRQQDF